MNEQVRHGAEEFFLPGSSEKGVVLVHGFTGAPPEMRLLGEFLQERGGFTILGIRLPGHGSTVEDLEKTRWPDWYRAVEEGVMRLRQHCAHVYIVGLSMGALLAMKAAVELPVEKAAFLAAPIFLQDKRLPFVKVLRYFIRRVKKHKRFYNVGQEYQQGYEETPTRPLPSLLGLLALCKNDYLLRIRIPVLIVQSKDEKTVEPDSARYIYQRLRSVPPAEKELLWLENSGHIVTLGEAREVVFARCLAFFSKNAAVKTEVE